MISKGMVDLPFEPTIQCRRCRTSGPASSSPSIEGPESVHPGTELHTNPYWCAISLEEERDSLEKELKEERKKTGNLIERLDRIVNSSQ